MRLNWPLLALLPRCSTMRSLPLVLLAAACSWSPPQLPVRVVGDGERGVVRGHELVRAARAPRSARRVLDDDGWRALREDCERLEEK